MAQEHMAAAETAVGLTWHEETATDLLLVSAGSDVLFETFTKREEARTGADWLWWWVDRTGECFGMLVQAKRLRGTAGSSNKTIDFQYDNGRQF